MTTRLLLGDCRQTLRTLADRSVQVCVTSPPYFGLRDYGHAEQIGLEPTSAEYVAALVEVFREVRRVLRDDGTLWLNLGDSYNGSGKASDTRSGFNGRYFGTDRYSGKQDETFGQMPDRTAVQGLGAKQLLMIPARVALALQDDGWYLRSDIIWAKPNPMPESVTDRPTKSHEYLFLLAKSARYFYDAEAVKEEGVSGESDIRKMQERALRIGGKTLESDDPKYAANAGSNIGQRRGVGTAGSRNRRSVWTIATTPYSGAHFATFPAALVEPCVLAGSSPQACEMCGAPWERILKRTAMVIDRSERTHDRGQTRTSGAMLEPPTSETLGWHPTCACEGALGTARCVVLDPFGGAGTTGLVADRLGRDAILCELNPEYATLAHNRVADDSPLFAEVVTVSRATDAPLDSPSLTPEVP